jgi:sporulation protein YlmC with PRC-barrel domain
MRSDTHLGLGELKGRHVIDSRGKDIGEVRDVAIDADGWRVTDLVVNVRKDVAEDLGLDAPLLGGAALRIGTERVQSIGDTVLLNLSEAEMRGEVRLG